ncbi:MAG: hypothetical protein PQJ44_06800, partial [Sphaerochaetaceae bacterium]|nr:hypothetical protein [Sphaerochaetaceae bacterium]
MTTPDEISAIIQKQIEESIDASIQESIDKEIDKTLDIDDIGTVLQVGDGIARIYGLEDVMAGELLEFDEGTVGIALNLENDNIGAVLMGDGRDILEGSTVLATGRIAQIPVGKDLLGRVVDPLASPIDG